MLLALAIDCGRAAPINKTHTRPVLAQRDHGRADPGYALDEGFHADPDGSAVTAGWHHTCALRFHEGADFGGKPRWQFEKERAKEEAAAAREKNEALMKKYGCTDRESCQAALKAAQ